MLRESNRRHISTSGMPLPLSHLQCSRQCRTICRVGPGAAMSVVVESQPGSTFECARRSTTNNNRRRPSSFGMPVFWSCVCAGWKARRGLRAPPASSSIVPHPSIRLLLLRTRGKHHTAVSLRAHPHRVLWGPFCALWWPSRGYAMPQRRLGLDPEAPVVGAAAGPPAGAKPSVRSLVPFTPRHQRGTGRKSPNTTTVSYFLWWK